MIGLLVISLMMNEELSKPIEIPKPLLDGFVYFEAHNWTIWLSGKAYHALGKINDEWSLQDVSDHKVILQDKAGKKTALLGEC